MIDATFSSSPPAAASRGHMQFTLLQAFIVVGVISALCALARLVGLAPTLVVILCGSIALVTHSIRRDNMLMTAAGLLIGAVSIGILIPGSGEMRGSGRQIRPLTMVVWDTKSGAPVVGAMVRIREVSDVTFYQNGVPITSISPQEKETHGLTDTHGSVTLNWRFRSSSYESLWRHQRFLHLGGELWIQVEAPGRGIVVVPMNSLLPQRYDCDQLPLPTLRIDVP